MVAAEEQGVAGLAEAPRHKGHERLLQQRHGHRVAKADRGGQKERVAQRDGRRAQGEAERSKGEKGEVGVLDAPPEVADVETACADQPPEHPQAKERLRAPQAPDKPRAPLQRAV